MSESDDAIDWSMTTWEGSRREQMRRAAKIPFDRILDCLEEMAYISEELVRQSMPNKIGRPPPIPPMPGTPYAIASSPEFVGQ